MVIFADLTAAFSLVVLAGGLAVLLIGIRHGLIVTTTLTFLLLLAPASWLPMAPAMRTLPMLGLWGGVGMVWLTVRASHIAGELALSAYERSQKFMEAARNDRLQLKQTLADLHAANQQLAHLGRWADGLRREAEAARRAKEEFVANVSHELRTPLNMIIGLSEMMVNAPQIYGRRLPPALMADLMIIFRNGQHLASLIDDVLDLSQLEAGQMWLAREQIAVGEVITEAEAAVKPLYESKGLYLHTELPGDLPHVMADRTRIREVVLNLLSNAARFTERGGVTICVRRRQEDLVVSVADTGPGIAETDQARLFQPFQQLESSLRRRYSGSGLGLSISKKFVELHGGKMWVESKPGAGATFFFTLPIDSEPSATVSASRWLIPGWEFLTRTRPSLAPKTSVRQRIVICDPSESLKRASLHYLPHVEVVAVSDLAQAVHKVGTMPAQALLVNAASITEAMRRPELGAPELQNTPVVICSIPSTLDIVSGLGIADYLIKPLSREKLLATLDRLRLTRKKILVADDDDDTLQLLWRLLASSGRGYQVLTANGGRQAWQILNESRPDALLLDLMMPEVDGFELLAAKNADPTLRDIPTVVISARDPVGQPIVSKALAITYGKGFSLPRLLTCIEAISALLSPMQPPPDPALATTPRA
jgi:signal transduction histidine kinase/CheY-like chemotaxis protein